MTFQGQVIYIDEELQGSEDCPLGGGGGGGWWTPDVTGAGVDV